MLLCIISPQKLLKSRHSRSQKSDKRTEFPTNGLMGVRSAPSPHWLRPCSIPAVNLGLQGLIRYNEKSDPIFCLHQSK